MQETHSIERTAFEGCNHYTWYRPPHTLPCELRHTTAPTGRRQGKAERYRWMDAGSARRTVASSNQRVCQAGRGPLQARFEFAVIEQFAGPVSGEIRLGLPLLAAFPIPKTATARGTGGRETGILGTTRAAYGCGGTRADSEFGCESTFGALRFVLF